MCLPYGAPKWAHRAAFDAMTGVVRPPDSPYPEVPDMPDLIEEARTEYEESGTLATDTYIGLNNAGFNADILLAQFAGEIDNGES